MANFLDSLRMDGIFGNSRPLGMPNMGGEVSVANFMRDVLPTLLQENQRNRDHETALTSMRMPGGNKLQNIGDSLMKKEPMNVVYKPSPSEVMSEFQKGQLGLQKEKLEQQGALASGKLDFNNRSLDIRQQQVDINKLKAENPNLKFMATKGGNIVAFNPVTGESHDTGISSGMLSDEQRLEMTHGNRLEEIGKQGEINRGNIFARSAEESKHIKERGEESRLTKETIPGKAEDTKPELPTQTRVNQFLKARELYNTRPDLRPFINIDNNGFSISMPSKGFFGNSGPDEKQLKEINDFIYAASAPVTPTKKTESVKPKELIKTQTNSKGDKRTLVSTDNGKTWQVRK